LNCLFAKPVVVGASISAQMGRSVPGYNWLVDVMAFIEGRPVNANFGLSPAKLLIANYAAKGFNFQYPNYSIMFTQQDKDLGSSQVNALIVGDQQEVFKSASVVLGIDPFYWDAVDDNCDYGHGQFSGVETTIYWLTRYAKDQGTRLILGNIPQEDPNQVIINSEKYIIPGLWYQPTPSCVDSINSTLQRYCKVENGCYLVDIDAIVQKLNRGEKLPGHNVEMSPIQNGLFDLRPDGVHLSPQGTATIFDGAVAALEASPPQCH
jgi:hypothetical protein